MSSDGKMKPIELGTEFGNLRVIGIGKPSRKGRYWVCQCLKCDAIKEVRGDHLRGNATGGCSAACTNTIHGSSGRNRTKEYRTWDHIIQRCNNTTSDGYDNYGGRGISVCERWRSSFEAFLEDMGPCPEECDGGIDRIKNDEGYKPGNCRWATRKQQGRNMRSNRLITIDGETKTLAEWLEQTSTKRLRFYKRIWAGWSEHDALFGKHKEKDL